MSRWTHVSGMVRIDHAQFFGPLDVATHFRPWHFESDNATIAASNMPAGSEGSLKRSIWTNPDSSSLAAYTVSVWGDLRNYGTLDDMLALQTWFRETCAVFRSVRQALLMAEESLREHSFLMAWRRETDFHEAQWVLQPLVPQESRLRTIP